MAGNIDRDIETIAHAESGEDVRYAIIGAIQDLNQNGGNAQTLNGYGSDEFTKNPQFEQFVNEEVGQIHLVLDAINKGITLRVIELGNKWIGPEANNDVQIQVPDTVRDRQLLTVDDFYADIVEVEGGTGENASWQKSDSYDSALGIYHYAHGALAGRVKLHFYAKRASATAVQDYNVHARDRITANGEYNADPGEAWDKVKVEVNVKEEITCNVTENHREYVPANPGTTSYNKVVVDVPDSLEEGGVTINQATFDQTFTPTSPNVGFSKFRVQADVRFNTQPKEVRISDAEFEDLTVTPDSTHAGLSQVSIVNDMQLEEVTVNQNGIVEPSSGFAALKKVTVQVPTPTPRLQEKTVTQNGDVTADANFDGLSTVHVQVSGGGGGNCNIMDRATWDALTFEQKKASRLTVIKNSLTDLIGAWFDLTTSTSDYLPYSRNIIGDASIDNFDATSHSWGGFTLSNTLTANADGIGVDIFGRPDASQGHPDVEFVYCDLGDVNTDFTAYLVCRYSTDFAYSAIIGASYEESAGNCAYIIESGINNVAGVCGSSSVVGSAHTANTYIVVAIRNDNKNISFFKNGVKGTDRTAYNVGQYVTLTTPYPNGTNYSTQITAAYAGVVAEAEPDSTVLENIKYLMEKFNIS